MQWSVLYTVVFALTIIGIATLPMTTGRAPARFSCPTPYSVRPKHIEADFSGGTITSHAGLLLAGLAEGHLG